MRRRRRRPPRFPARRNVINTALASGLSMLVNDAGTSHMEQGAPMGQQLRALGEAPGQQTSPRWRNIEADQHGHQPGEGGGDGGSRNAPLGEGARPEDQQRIQHAVDQTGDPITRLGSWYPRSPDGGIATMGTTSMGTVRYQMSM